MSFGHFSDYEHSQESSFLSDSWNEHFYSGGATTQSAADLTSEDSGALPLQDIRSFKSVNQSVPSSSSLCLNIGSAMNTQLPTGQASYRANDNPAGGAINPPYFDVPVDPAISQDVGQARPNAPFAWHANLQPGHHQRVRYQRYSQDYLRLPRFYMGNSLPYHRGFHLSNDQDKALYHFSHTAGGMSPSQMHMPPTTMYREQAHVEQRVGFYGLDTLPSSGETTLPLPHRPWGLPIDPAAASTSVTQGLTASRCMPEIVPAAQGEAYAAQSAFAVPQHSPPLSCHQDLPAPLPADMPMHPFPGFLPSSVSHGMQPNVSNTSSSQLEDYINRRPLPSQTDASVSPTSTREPVKKRKKPCPGDDGHSHTCGWGRICIAKVHPNCLRDHLRVHLDGVKGDRARCEYDGCSRAMKKDGLARHYLIHFGARAECCDCERNFARPDEITRGHKTNDNISCPSKRWRRFTVDDNGNRNYI